eukprot:TRINITY_DN205_c0_g2_i2.p2 TRINITY_DN205_c0_g2~~TRINITY_DN205_c0_g2_i2.p2  ORF type:complete len:206 (-),score=32.81 TRINITY_DN205_c0_g2_i2:995-1612(-)
MSSRKVDLKIILLGPANAGKTCFLTRYIRNEFGRTEATVGASFALKVWHGLKFGIWDTAGQEKYDSLSSFYCRSAGAVILVYDVCEKSSFEELPRFVDKLTDCEPNCIVVVIGTKVDQVEEQELPRQVKTSSGMEFAKSLNAHFLETSSKNNTNVSEVFDYIGQTIQSRRSQHTSALASPTATTTIELQSPAAGTPAKPSGGCSC